MEDTSISPAGNIVDVGPSESELHVAVFNQELGGVTLDVDLRDSMAVKPLIFWTWEPMALMDFQPVTGLVRTTEWIAESSSLTFSGKPSSLE